MSIQFFNLAHYVIIIINYIILKLFIKYPNNNKNKYKFYPKFYIIQLSKLYVIY